MHTLFLDLETFSHLNLQEVGVYRYAAHESTKIQLLGYALDDEAVQVWDAEQGEPIPARLEQALADPGVVKIAQNSAFDRNVIGTKLVPVPVEQWEDTMVIAYTLGLRGNLEQMLIDLGAEPDFQKAADGKRLVSMFCMPQKVTKNQPFKVRGPLTDPEDWGRYIEYCAQDVEAMRWAYHTMPRLNIGRDGTDAARRELELWHLSERINDRGLPIDVELAERAVALTEAEVDRLNAELTVLTQGSVTAHSKRNAMLAWLTSQGVQMKGYTKEDLTGILKTEVPPQVRRALEIRQEAGRTSTAKYQALLSAVSEDGRLRGAIQYYAARRTGRYGGRRFQPQNLPHPEIPDSDAGAEAIVNGTVDLLYDESPMAIAVSCVRSTIRAAEGKVLGVSDLSNIEGRKLAWLAGEDWKLEAFRKFDAGIGPDIYKVAYAKAFGADITDIGKPERQIGKYQELSLGYQGGVGAFYEQAKKFGTDMLDIYYQVVDMASPDMMSSAEWMVEWIRENRKDLNELTDEEIIGCDLVKQSWRMSNPKIVAFWGALEDMVRKAITNPGRIYRAGQYIKASMRDGRLLVRIPSGRFLVYASPKVGHDGTILCKAVDNNRWITSVLYGGKLAENVTQAGARDVMTHNMSTIDRVLPIIGTVHDEIITEHDVYSPLGLDWLNERLATVPTWAEGLPLAADGYTSTRYRKD